MKIKAYTAIVIDIEEHPNADELDIYRVISMGSEVRCIQRKGYLEKGEIGILFYPGSYLPEVEWAREYSKYVKKEIRKISIRGIRSYGILEKYELVFPIDPYEVIDKENYPLINFDVSKFLIKEIVEVKEYISFSNKTIPGKGKVGILVMEWRDLDEDKYLKIDKLVYEIVDRWINNKQEFILRLQQLT